MNFKIVADSSSNVFRIPGVNYSAVPMKVVAGDKEFVDTEALDLQGMVDYLASYKGKSGSSCPNVQEWLEAFGDADCVFGITITKHLSGSYNAAQQAAQIFQEEHPDKKICIIDSLSAGPEMVMIAEKLQELIDAGHDFETIKEQILDYSNHNHTLFCLRSMNNLARNGRVHPAVAKIAGMLNIRAVGDVEGGEITPTEKPRGDKRATDALVAMIKERGFYDGAILRIAHCFGEVHAKALADAMLAEFPNAKVTIEPTTALCSFYAEAGGLMIGFQGSFNAANDNSKF